MDEKKLQELWFKQEVEWQNHIENKSGEKIPSKSLRNRIWRSFHKRNFILIGAFLTSLVVTIIITWDYFHALVLQAKELSTSHMIWGIGVILLLVMMVVATFLNFFTDE